MYHHEPDGAGPNAVQHFQGSGFGFGFGFGSGLRFGFGFGIPTPSSQVIRIWGLIITITI